MVVVIGGGGGGATHASLPIPKPRMPLRDHVPLLPHPRRSLLTKPCTDPASSSSTLLKSAAYAAAAGRGGGGGGGSGGASDSLFCTNVSGLKGNSPILIGLMEYFSVRRGLPGLRGRLGPAVLELGKSSQTCARVQEFSELAAAVKLGGPSHLPACLPACRNRTTPPLPAAPHAARGLLPAHRSRPTYARRRAARQAAQARRHVGAPCLAWPCLLPRPALPVVGWILGVQQ